MRNNTWGAPVDWDTVCRRASGRRRYQSCRRLQRAVRRHQVLRLLRQYGGLVAGVQTRIARELHCHRSTICRDVAALLATPPSVPRGAPAHISTPRWRSR
jgi:hypothetical protein